MTNLDFLNLDFLKGKRFWLFVILGLMGAIQYIQPLVDEQVAGIFTAAFSILGIIKTFFPYEKPVVSEPIDRIPNPNSTSGF